MKTFIKKKNLSLAIMIIFVVGFIFITPKPVSAGFVYVYKYWSDDAIESWDTDVSGGGVAYVDYTDLDDLGLYCDTDGGYESAKGWIYIDGGYEATDPWTFSTNWYNWYMYWVIDGHYDELGAASYFKFEYTLYYMVGATPHKVDQFTYEYTSDFTYTAQTVIHTSPNAVKLYSTYVYYLKCTITLNHATGTDGVSDMYFSDYIDFTYAVFRYKTGVE